MFVYISKNKRMINMDLEEIRRLEREHLKKIEADCRESEKNITETLKDVFKYISNGPDNEDSIAKKYQIKPSGVKNYKN